MDIKTPNPLDSSPIVNKKKITNDKKNNKSSTPSQRVMKFKKKCTIANLHVTAKKNNTHVTLTGINDFETLFKGSCGSVKTPQGHVFKNTKKSKPQASQNLLNHAGEVARSMGIIYIKLFVKYDGIGRENTQLNHFLDHGIQIIEAIDLTPIQHGGCRRRRAARN